jgi:hypothetical protein
MLYGNSDAQRNYSGRWFRHPAPSADARSQQAADFRRRRRLRAPATGCRALIGGATTRATESGGSLGDHATAIRLAAKSVSQDALDWRFLPFASRVRGKGLTDLNRRLRPMRCRMRAVSLGAFNLSSLAGPDCFWYAGVGLRSTTGPNQVGRRTTLQPFWSVGASERRIGGTFC